MVLTCYLVDIISKTRREISNVRSGHIVPMQDLCLLINYGLVKDVQSSTPHLGLTMSGIEATQLRAHVQLERLLTLLTTQ